MKKLVLFITMLALAFVVSAQSLTRTLPVMAANATYQSYTGTAADTLATAQDSLIFIFQLNQNMTTKWNIGVKFSKIVASDTLVTIRIAGKYFADEAWSASLAIGTTANITTAAIQKTLSYGTAVGYRYVRVSLQMIGIKGRGAKLEKIELKAVQQ
jgi:hypothetical protein